MNFSFSEYALWSFTTLMETVICALIFRFRSYRVIPFFSTYLCFAVVRSLALWWIYHVPTLEAGFVYNFYWVTQLLLLVGRGLGVAEVCRLSLREYRGVWELTWRLLVGVGIVLIAFAGVAALYDPRWVSPVVLRGERGLELAIIAVLAALGLVCRYYQISVPRPVKWLGLGLGLYAGVQVINDVIEYAAHGEFPLWRGIHQSAFAVALVIWFGALRKPLALVAPSLAEPETYEEIAPAVSYRLRELNARLLEMLK